MKPYFLTSCILSAFLMLLAYHHTSDLKYLNGVRNNLETEVEFIKQDRDHLLKVIKVHNEVFHSNKEGEVKAPEDTHTMEEWKRQITEEWKEAEDWYVRIQQGELSKKEEDTVLGNRDLFTRICEAAYNRHSLYVGDVNMSTLSRKNPAIPDITRKDW